MCTAFHLCRCGNSTVHPSTSTSLDFCFFVVFSVFIVEVALFQFCRAAELVFRLEVGVVDPGGTTVATCHTEAACFQANPRRFLDTFYADPAAPLQAAGMYAFRSVYLI